MSDLKNISSAGTGHNKKASATVITVGVILGLIVIALLTLSFLGIIQLGNVVTSALLFAVVGAVVPLLKKLFE